jgi:fatty-acyl-CoA synthase
MAEPAYDRNNSRTALLHWYLERLAAQSPETTAYSYEPVGVETTDGDSGTWNDLNKKASRMAAEFAAAGVTDGDFVATLLPQSPQYTASYAGVAKLGATIVPLDFRAEPREIADVLDRTTPTAFFGVDQYRGDSYSDVLDEIDAFEAIEEAWWLDETDPTTAGSAITDRVQRYEWSVVDAEGTDLAAADATGELDPGSPLLVVFTSGTTGRPKGALLSHRSTVFQGTAMTDSWGVDESDTTLAHLPPSHVGGSTELLATALVAGTEITFLDAIDPGTALDRIEGRSVTVLGNVPALWEMFFAFPDYQDQLASIDLAVVAGQAPSEDTLEKMSEIGTVVTGWGLTETGGFVTLTDVDTEFEVLTETVGKPYDGFEVRTIDNDGNWLESGETGELLVKGDGTMVGYLDAKHGNEWIRTGDMGYIDNSGRLHLQGRAHEMYISGGYNVYPAEVEDVLTDHPAVKLATVIGVEDERWGEAGHAFVVHVANSDLTASELETYCEGQLAKYKRPREYTIKTNLPKTMLGKIDRQALVDEFDL